MPKEQWNKPKTTPWGRIAYIDYKERMEFSSTDYEKINRYCLNIGIKWSASVWDIPSFYIIDKYPVPFIKIASACITNLELLKVISQTDKDIVFSIGMSTSEQVKKAASFFQEEKLTILHCNSSYPAKEDELDLAFIPELKRLFPKAKVGYSGHEEGMLPTLVAKALGAEVIERHITLDRVMWGTDHKASLEPKEFRKLVQEINRVGRILGEPHLHVYESEMEAAKKLRFEKETKTLCTGVFFI